MVRKATEKSNEGIIKAVEFSGLYLGAGRGMRVVEIL
jgi:hypothetical protein